MTCLTKAATKDVEDLGRAIAGGKRTDYEKHKEQYEDNRASRLLYLQSVV